jgi:hypothetical protein
MRRRRNLRNQLAHLSNSRTVSGQIGLAVTVAQLLPKSGVVRYQSAMLDRRQRLVGNAVRGHVSNAESVWQR